MQNRAVAHDVWVAKVHLVAREGCRPFPDRTAIGAYTNCITKAHDETEFKGKVKAFLGIEGFDVTEFENPERLAERIADVSTPDDRTALQDILELIDEADLKVEVRTTDIHTYSEGFGPD